MGFINRCGEANRVRDDFRGKIMYSQEESPPHPPPGHSEEWLRQRGMSDSEMDLDWLVWIVSAVFWPRAGHQSLVSGSGVIRGRDRA